MVGPRSGRSSISNSAMKLASSIARKPPGNPAEHARPCRSRPRRGGGSNRLRSGPALGRDAEAGEQDRAHHRHHEGARQRAEEVQRAHGDADLVVRHRVLDRHRGDRIDEADRGADHAQQQRRHRASGRSGRQTRNASATSAQAEPDHRRALVVLPVQHRLAGQQRARRGQRDRDERDAGLGRAESLCTTSKYSGTKMVSPI